MSQVLLGEVNAGLSTTQVVVKELKASASVQDQMQFLEEVQPYRSVEISPHIKHHLVIKNYVNERPDNWCLCMLTLAGASSTLRSCSAWLSAQRSLRICWSWSFALWWVTHKSPFISICHSLNS